MLNIKAHQLESVLQRLGHKIFDDGKPYHLNVVGIRSKPGVPNKFDDTLCIFFKDEKGVRTMYRLNITTEPGRYWLNNPGRVEGTAVLARGQHLYCWAMGFHKGEYPALVQVGPMTVYRDNDKDDIAEEQGIKQKGIFGINLHRSNPNTQSINVEKWSAGCQVTSKDEELDIILALARQHFSYRDENISYTLIYSTDL